jgi:ribosomal protein L37AE/L43A
MTLQRRHRASHMEMRGGYERRAGLMYFCDMCGRTHGVKEIEHYEGSIWLCQRCNDQINHLSKKLDEITELFIIGNAL